MTLLTLEKASCQIKAAKCQALAVLTHDPCDVIQPGSQSPSNQIQGFKI